MTSLTTDQRLASTRAQYRAHLRGLDWNTPTLPCGRGMQTACDEHMRLAYRLQAIEQSLEPVYEIG